MTKYQQMSLISFQKQFSTQEACHDHLFSLKGSNGYCCEKCGHDAYFETKTRKTGFMNARNAVIKPLLPLEP
jgi:anaerobic ribonucleoside-triphosphate reductase